MQGIVAPDKFAVCRTGPDQHRRIHHYGKRPDLTASRSDEVHKSDVVSNEATGIHDLRIMDALRL